MLSASDERRLRDLVELDRRGKLSEYVNRVAHELRREGIGQARDPRELPPLASALRVYEQVYQPPSSPNSAEVVHVLFPGTRHQIADAALNTMIRELSVTR